MQTILGSIFTILGFVSKALPMVAPETLAWGGAPGVLLGYCWNIFQHLLHISITPGAPYLLRLRHHPSHSEYMPTFVYSWCAPGHFLHSCGTPGLPC